MSEATVRSYVLRGVEAVPVTVKVELQRKLPALTIVGLPAVSVKETAERVRSAIEASGFELPRTRILVKIEGLMLTDCGLTAGLDLPIALGILRAAGLTDEWPASRPAHVGELSLSGHVRPVRGLLNMALQAQADGYTLVGPVGPNVYPVSNLRDAADRHIGPKVEPWYQPGPSPVNFADVRGAPDPTALEALVEAARSVRPLLLVGPPGCGKSMIARRFVDILPSPTVPELAEIGRCFDAAGLREGPHMPTARPFRAPHHTVSSAGMAGTHRSPGEVTLAHRGVLFLDGVHEFTRAVLEVVTLCQRSGEAGGGLHVGRGVINPASFHLLASTEEAYLPRALRLLAPLDPLVVRLPTVDVREAAHSGQRWPSSAELRARVVG